MCDGSQPIPETTQWKDIRLCIETENELTDHEHRDISLLTLHEKLLQTALAVPHEILVETVHLTTSSSSAAETSSGIQGIFPSSSHLTAAARDFCSALVQGSLGRSAGVS